MILVGLRRSLGLLTLDKSNTHDPWYMTDEGTDSDDNADADNDRYANTDICDV